MINHFFPSGSLIAVLRLRAFSPSPKLSLWRIDNNGNKDKTQIKEDESSGFSNDAFISLL